MVFEHTVLTNITHISESCWTIWQVLATSIIWGGMKSDSYHQVACNS